MKTHALVASFSQPAQAAQAVQALCRSDFRAGDIYVNNTPRGKSDKDTKTLRVLSRAPGKYIAFYAGAGALIGFGEGLFFINRVGFVQSFLLNHHLLIIASGALLGMMFATIFGALLHSDQENPEYKELEGSIQNGDIEVCLELDDQSLITRGKMIFEYYDANQVIVTSHPPAPGRMETHQVS